MLISTFVYFQRDDYNYETPYCTHAPRCISIGGGLVITMHSEANAALCLQ